MILTGFDNPLFPCSFPEISPLQIFRLRPQNDRGISKRINEHFRSHRSCRGFTVCAADGNERFPTLAYEVPKRLKIGFLGNPELLCMEPFRVIRRQSKRVDKKPCIRGHRTPVLLQRDRDPLFLQSFREIALRPVGSGNGVSRGLLVRSIRAESYSPDAGTEDIHPVPFFH